MDKKKIFIAWAALIGWMVLIAFMSHQNASVSDSQSLGAIEYLEKLNINLDVMLGEKANFFVRKCAHFIEYMILAILFFNVLVMYFPRKKVIVITIILCALYAMTDEIHQLYIPGRQGALRDVIIDTSGACFGTFIRNLLKDRS